MKQSKKSEHKRVRPGFMDMSLAELSGHLIDVQQPYLRKALSTFRLCGETLAKSDNKMQGIRMLADTVSKLADLIEKHMNNEEKFLFPFLNMKIQNPDSPQQHFYLDIRKMKAEHTSIKKRFEKARLISNEYTAPPHSSPVLKLCYAQLFNFEQDMLKNIFLEEELLFPKLLKSQAQSEISRSSHKNKADGNQFIL